MEGRLGFGGLAESCETRNVSPEDLKQIRAVVREEIQDNNQVLRDEMRVSNEALAATLREEMRAGNQALAATLREEMRAGNEALAAALREEFSERLGAAVVAISTDFSQLRGELSGRMETLEKSMRALETRMDRVAETSAGVHTEMAALDRWATRIEKDYTDLSNTQFAQQRAIDELVKRWNPPPAPPPAPPQT